MKKMRLFSGLSKSAKIFEHLAGTVLSRRTVPKPQKLSIDYLVVVIIFLFSHPPLAGAQGGETSFRDLLKWDELVEEEADAARDRERKTREEKVSEGKGMAVVLEGLERDLALPKRKNEDVAAEALKYGYERGSEWNKKANGIKK